MRNNRNKPPERPKKYRCRACDWEGPGPLVICEIFECEHCPKCGSSEVTPVWKGMNDMGKPDPLAEAIPWGYGV